MNTIEGKIPDSDELAKILFEIYSEQQGIVIANVREVTQKDETA